MRAFEIILKILFLAGSAYSIKAETVPHGFLIAYLLVCLVLGLILFFNKKQSYGYELARREVIMRRIEGGILVVFAIAVFCIQVI